MNRLIKFRAWDRQESKMYEVRSLHNIHSGVNIHADLCTGSVPAVRSNHYDVCDHQDSFVYLQFTGLLDKNGKEIYEGDVVENQAHAKREVKKIASGEYRLFCGKHHSSFSDGWATGTVWEVIGNVYEHPNLLPHD